MQPTLGLYTVCNYTQLLCRAKLVGQLRRGQREQSKEGHRQKSKQQEEDKRKKSCVKQDCRVGVGNRTRSGCVTRGKTVDTRGK